ncbi:MAG: PKD domain-containing protein [Prevotellaceae bacterium]|nr:PKD domain-containing protein [Prevotellaceae bacterium]
MKKHYLKKIALGTGLLLCATSMSAKDIFVAGDGNGNGLSASSPAKFNNLVLNGENGLLKNDDRIIVMPGTHKLDGTINIDSIKVSIIGYSEMDTANYANPANSIIDGNTMYRLFDISNGAQVKFSHLTLQNGKSNAIVSDSYNLNGGAAIKIDSSKVDMGYCAFINNVALGATDELFAYGGALRVVRKSTVNLYDVTFDGNTAFRGGAISVTDESSLKAEYCNFRNNGTVYSDTESRGGVISAADSDLDFNFCEFRGNSSQINAGVFFIVSCNTVINHSAIIGNQSGACYEGAYWSSKCNDDGHGGVFVILDGATTSIINTTIANNSALNHARGGIMFSSGLKVSLINATVVNNYTAYGECGGFDFMEENTEVEIINSIIERNNTGSGYQTYCYNSWADFLFGSNKKVRVEGSVCGANRAYNLANITSNDNSYSTYSYAPYSKSSPNNNLSGMTGNMVNTCYPLKANAVTKNLGIANYLFDKNIYDDQYGNVRTPDENGKIYAGAVQILEGENEKIKSVIAPYNNYYEYYNTGDDFFRQVEPEFSYIAGLFEVTFRNTSKYAMEYEWDFGDGNTSRQVNPIHIYAEMGSYEVKLIVRNYASVDSIKYEVKVDNFKKISNNKGGNNGFSSFDIYGGSWLNEQTVVKLVKDDATISTYTVYQKEPGVICATFNLTDKAIGVYDIVITINGQDYTITDGFTIENADYPYAFAELEGNSVFIPGRWQTYTVNYGNLSNTDIYGLPINLIFSDFADIEFLFDLVDSIGGASTNINDPDNYVSLSSLYGEPFNGKMYSVLIPHIPANTTSTLIFRMKINANSETKTYVSAGEVLNDMYFNTQEEEVESDVMFGYKFTNTFNIKKEKLSQIIRNEIDKSFNNTVLKKNFVNFTKLFDTYDILSSSKQQAKTRQMLISQAGGMEPDCKVTTRFYYLDYCYKTNKYVIVQKGKMSACELSSDAQKGIIPKLGMHNSYIYADITNDCCYPIYYYYYYQYILDGKIDDTTTKHYRYVRVDPGKTKTVQITLGDFNKNKITENGSEKILNENSKPLDDYSEEKSSF